MRATWQASARVTYGGTAVDRAALPFGTALGISEDDKRRIVEWAQRHREISAVYLYGSRARGDHEPDSDIDLGVTLNPSREEREIAWMDFIRAYRKNPDLNLSHEVQLEWYEKTADLKAVGGGVERDGVLLYPPPTGGADN